MTFERLSDVAIVTPGTSPKGELINSDGRGYPFFQGSKEFKELYPVVERYTELPVKLAKAGDILIGVRAPVGEVNFALHDCAIGRGVMSVRAKLQEEQKYIFYFLKNLQGKWDSLGSTGSVFENLSTIALNSVELPTVNNREMIGEILFNLDKKIAINNALSKTLEDIAQTIFKSWFIDFDPVKAKMNGKKPIGMDDETAALFPDSFEESELGLIPKGWEVKSIGNLCETLLGGTPSRTKDDYWNGDIPWINSGKINDFRVLTASEYITKRGLDKSATKLLPSGTTVIAITGATLGQFSRLEIEACANQSVIGIIGSPLASNEFIYMQIKNGINRLISAQTGGAQQHINKEDVNNFNIIYPNQALVSKFTSEVSAIFLQIGILLKQSMTIVSIRDSLLPRLISGELKIPEEMLAS